MASAVPPLLGGRYVIGDLLGRGGMAEVHRGVDERLGRTVAVKMLRPDLVRDPTAQVRFRREAHSSASLNHPSIVAVYDTGEDEYAGNPVPYIVMEHVAGSTLRDLLGSGSRLLPDRALEIVDGVLEALSYSHAQGIVHRDIKPANVMITTETRQVKVMDFGIARSLDDMAVTMTQTSAVIGTAQYLSPEQAEGKQVDTRSDLYSTGCLLYELLTGRPPFVGDSPVAVAIQHVQAQPLPPSSLDPDLPRGIDDIVLRALAKDRTRRYQTAGEMRRDIAAARSGRSVPPFVPVPVPQAARPDQTTRTVLPTTPVLAGTATYPAVGERPARRSTPQQQSNGRVGRALGYTLLAIGVLAVFVIVGLIVKSALGGSSASQVSAPQITGLTVPAARAALKAEGLTLGQQSMKADEQVPTGNIIDQNPESGTSVRTGTSVSVTVSTGVDSTTVPTLVGLSLDEAKQALDQAGLTLGDLKSVPSTETRSTVTKVTPNEGETVPRNSSVAMAYASGNNKVPDVTGKDEATARSALEQAGFTVGTSTTKESADKPAGTVLSQSTPGGQTLRLGSTVTFVVATAPPTATPLPTDTGPVPTPSATAAPTP